MSTGGSQNTESPLKRPNLSPPPLGERVSFSDYQHRLPAVSPLDIHVLGQLPSLALRSRYLVEGFISGKHKSPLTGHSVDFSEYRAYQKGDDLRSIDWRLYGRTNRLNVKVYEDETQLQVCLALDLSASLAYHSHPSLLTKLDYARTCAAGLSLLIRQQGDAAGLALISNDLDQYLPPSARKSRFSEICRQLDSAQPSQYGAFMSQVGTLPNILKQRSLVVLLSDFYDEPAHLQQTLRRLRYEGHEVIGLQVLDPAEIEFNLVETGKFLDVETGQLVNCSPDEVRETYLNLFRAFQHEIQQHFIQAGCDFISLRTDQPPVAALSSYLAHRQHRT